MIIILRRIPKNTEKYEVIEFLTPVLKGGFFKRAGRIEYIKILALNDTKRNTIEYHALVTIDSDSAAKRIIRKLNRKEFKNKSITVRQYFYRSWKNESRAEGQNLDDGVENKRKGNRRRTHVRWKQKR